MSKFQPKQILLDLDEYNQMQAELSELKKAPEDGSLTALELQEATGALLMRALQNPALFREDTNFIVSGKYRVQLVQAAEVGKEPKIHVKFTRHKWD